jgi:hypothetical protein
VADGAFEVVRVTLGLRPFLLIQVEEITEGRAAVRTASGGGIDSLEDEIVLMLTMIEQMTGVSAKALGREIDLARVAAGLPTLAEAIEASIE